MINNTTPSTVAHENVTTVELTSHQVAEIDTNFASAWHWYIKHRREFWFRRLPSITAISAAVSYSFVLVMLGLMGDQFPFEGRGWQWIAFALTIAPMVSIIVIQRPRRPAPRPGRSWR